MNRGLIFLNNLFKILVASFILRLVSHVPQRPTATKRSRTIPLYLRLLTIALYHCNTHAFHNNGKLNILSILSTAWAIYFYPTVKKG